MRIETDIALPRKSVWTGKGRRPVRWHQRTAKSSIAIRNIGPPRAMPLGQVASVG